MAGGLGSVTFEAGWHLYVGSALGPGGVAARVGRHLRSSGTRHWHVDHLRALVAPRAVWVRYGDVVVEHDWADALATAPGACPPIAGFGASDCGCATHLFHFARRPTPDVLGEAGEGVEVLELSARAGPSSLW